MKHSRWTHLIANLLLVATLVLPIAVGAGPSAGATTSVIVQASDLESAAAAVEAVDGEITHELGIINAVGADLTDAQRAALEAMEGITLHENRGVEVSAVAGTMTVRDEFNAVSYSNSDGTALWLTDWIESNDRGGPTGGAIEVDEDSDCPDGSRCLEFGSEAYSNASIERGVNLGGVSMAVLTFDYRVTDDDATWVLEVSSDGGDTWENSPLAIYDDEMKGNESIDLLPYASGTTRIRFRLVGGDDDGDLLVDNVQISFIENSPNSILETSYPTLVGADVLHQYGTTGDGVTVGVLDTGIWSTEPLNKDTDNDGRVMVRLTPSTTPGSILL